jgi:hypothetical protein
MVLLVAICVSGDASLLHATAFANTAFFNKAKRVCSPTI